MLQTKKRSSVNGQTMMIVSGRTVFDGLGRTVAQYYPVTEPLGQAGADLGGWTGDSSKIDPGTMTRIPDKYLVPEQ